MPLSLHRRLLVSTLKLKDHRIQGLRVGFLVRRQVLSFSTISSTKVSHRMAKCNYPDPRSLYRRSLGSSGPIRTGVRGILINDGLITEVHQLPRNPLQMEVATKYLHHKHNHKILHKHQLELPLKLPLKLP